MGCFLDIAETGSITLQSFLAVLALPLLPASPGTVGLSAGRLLQG